MRNLGMLGQQRANIVPVCERLEYPSGKDFCGDLAKQQSCQGCRWRWLCDDRVAGDQSRSELVRQQTHGEIPWRDRSDNSLRITLGNDRLLPVVAQDSVLQHGAGRVPDDIDGSLDFEFGLPERLALFERQKTRELELSLLECLGKFFEIWAPLLVSQSRPRRESGGGCCDSLVCQCGVCPRRTCKRLSRSRVDDFSIHSAADKAAIDEHFIGHNHFSIWFLSR